MNNKQIVVLTIGGFLIALNALFPPMQYTNRNINGRSGTRRFFTVEQVTKEVYPSGVRGQTKLRKTVYPLNINLPVLVTEEFIIFGLTMGLIGALWPEERRKS